MIVATPEKRDVEPEIHRVGPEIWVNSKALIEILSQTAGSTCESWVNPVNVTFRAAWCWAGRACRPTSAQRSPGSSLRLSSRRVLGAAPRAVSSAVHTNEE
jgi:hypothetical protein